MCKTTSPSPTSGLQWTADREGWPSAAPAVGAPGVRPGRGIEGGHRGGREEVLTVGGGEEGRPLPGRRRSASSPAWSLRGLRCSGRSPATGSGRLRSARPREAHGDLGLARRATGRRIGSGGGALAGGAQRGVCSTVRRRRTAGTGVGWRDGALGHGLNRGGPQGDPGAHAKSTGGGAIGGSGLWPKAGLRWAGAGPRRAGGCGSGRCCGLGLDRLRELREEQQT
jgi:hypothetical protein